MAEGIDPLKYHYESGIKLDYFILSADIALLGWTVVNTDWLPEENYYYYLISIFWLLIIFSIIFGIIRQLFNSMVFGINHQYLHAGELANVIERAAIKGGPFMDQQSGKVSSSEEFKKRARSLRDKEKSAKDLYEKYNKRSMLFANLSTVCLVLSLFMLAYIKFATFKFD